MTHPLPPQAGGFDASYASEQLRRSRHPLRRLIKGFYLRSALSQVQGPTIDYGCGAGQLLALLPAGSLGLEVNPHLVAAHTQAGLSIQQWSADEQGFDLAGLDDRGFRTLIISHVLEHLPNPTASFSRLLRACERLGVARVVAVVPGSRGFASDTTHLTFIDSHYLVNNGWDRLPGYKLSKQRFFPLPREAGGGVYVYNEMQLVFDQIDSGAA